VPDAAALDDDALALAEPLPLTIAGLAGAGEEQQSDGMPASLRSGSSPDRRSVDSSCRTPVYSLALSPTPH